MALFKRQKLHRRGFTLVEVVVAIAILGIVSAATALLARSSSELAVRSNEQFFAANAVNSVLEVYKAYPEDFADFEASLLLYCGASHFAEITPDEKYEVYYNKAWQFCEEGQEDYILTVKIIGNVFSAKVSKGEETVYELKQPYTVTLP